jgi:hypothetical protein
MVLRVFQEWQLGKMVDFVSEVYLVFVAQSSWLQSSTIPEVKTSGQNI